MSTPRQRGLTAVAVALTLSASACSERPREAADVVADTMTTPTIRRYISSELRASEQSLQRLDDYEDSAQCT